ncbi:MAG: hypothetical protein AB8B69_21175, partial [Chitinophagales bacterium]
MLILLTRIMHWFPGLLIGLVLLWIFSWLYCKLFCQPSTERRLNAKHKGEIEEIKSRLMFLQSQHDKLLKDKEEVDIALQNCRDESTRLSGELGYANDENSKYKNRILGLEVFQTKYEDTNQKYQKAETGLNALQLSFGQLETNHSGLKNDLADRDKEIAKYRSSISDLTVYKDKYNVLFPRSQKMEAELKELRGALQSKESTIETQKSSIFDLGKFKTEAIALGSALALANTAKASQENANTKLQGEYDVLLARANQLDADHANCSTEISALQASNHGLTANLEDRNDEYDILMEQATQLQEDCAYYMNRLDAGEESYQELAEDLRDRNDEYDVLMAQATQLQEDSAFYLNRLDAAEEAYNELKG